MRERTHLSIDRHRLVEDAVHSEDGRLRRVDDWGAEDGTEHSTIGNGERAALHVLHGQLVVARLQGIGN